MSEDIRLETNFEHYISRKLQELSDTGDWQVSQNDDGFDPNTGLVMDDFVAYVNAGGHIITKYLPCIIGQNVHYGRMGTLRPALEMLRQKQSVSISPARGD